MKNHNVMIFRRSRSEGDIDTEVNLSTESSRHTTVEVATDNNNNTDSIIIIIILLGITEIPVGRDNISYV